MDDVAQPDETLTAAPRGSLLALFVAAFLLCCAA